MHLFDPAPHILFALRHAKFLPSPYSAEDANRMTLGYFCLASLALLPDPSPSSRSALETMLKPAQRLGIADWVYRQQAPTGGFRGSDSVAPDAGDAAAASYDPPNLIQSYTALLVLALVEDDLERLDRRALLEFVARCQFENRDGSFSLSPGSGGGGGEPGDPRSTYAAFAICSILNDWSTIDVDRALSFLDACRRFEGGFAQRPNLEANAGPTYCAIASYDLCGRIDSVPRPETLFRWLVDRQISPSALTDCISPATPSSASSSPVASRSGQQDQDEDDDDDENEDEDEQTRAAMMEGCAGFQGRANKPLDACYSFWSLGALSLLLSSTGASTGPHKPHEEETEAVESPVGDKVDAVARENASVRGVSHASDLERPPGEEGSRPRPRRHRRRPSGGRPIANVDALVDLVDTALDSRWLLACQYRSPYYGRSAARSVTGGIARDPDDALPDVYHTYLSLAALSIGQPPLSRPPSPPPPRRVPQGGNDDDDKREERGTRGGQGRQPERGLELGLRRLNVAWNVEAGVAERLERRIGGLQARDGHDSLRTATMHRAHDRSR